MLLLGAGLTVGYEYKLRVYVSNNAFYLLDASKALPKNAYFIEQDRLIERARYLCVRPRRGVCGPGLDLD